LLTSYNGFKLQAASYKLTPASCRSSTRRHSYVDQSSSLSSACRKELTALILFFTYVLA